jgi:hypothetical protein
MPLPPNIKDYAELLDHTLTVLTILGVLAGWLYTSRKRKEAGAKAVEQINHMAVNCIPTIQRNGEETNKHLEQQTEILQNIDKGIAVLVDRQR